MADRELVRKLWESDQASTLTYQAAREIERLEAELQKVINDRNRAWCQLEENGIEIIDISDSEECDTYKPEEV